MQYLFDIGIIAIFFMLGFIAGRKSAYDEVHAIMDDIEGQKESLESLRLSLQQSSGSLKQSVENNKPKQ